eukprot:8862431-Lingulodinium_polyedra.AAC.1
MLHPRWVLTLPAGMRRRLLAILEATGRLGAGPLLARLLLTVFLPKPAGGSRPIGLMHFLARIWGRLRHQERASWEEAHARPYFAGTRGCS